MENDETSPQRVERVTDRIEYKGVEITFEELLHEYDPEGLYEIANKLVELADDDVWKATRNSYQ
tara:strand:- start:889 stop:1080 length:192 start_codon:yes stop_codon:yes gene_type:complete